MTPFRNLAAASPVHRCGTVLLVPGPPRRSVCLYGLSAFGAEEGLPLGPGPQVGVDDERESHLGDVPGGLDCPVGGALPGVGFGFCGHELSSCVVGAAGLSGRAAAS